MAHNTLSSDAGSFTHAPIIPSKESMSRVISDWKRFHACKHQVAWQEGYFDHRLRDDERGEQLSMKIDYIRRNPVAAGLRADIADWPWTIEALE